MPRRGLGRGAWVNPNRLRRGGRRGRPHPDCVRSRERHGSTRRTRSSGRRTRRSFRRGELANPGGSRSRERRGLTRRDRSSGSKARGSVRRVERWSGGGERRSVERDCRQRWGRPRAARVDGAWPYSGLSRLTPICSSRVCGPLQWQVGGAGSCFVPLSTVPQRRFAMGWFAIAVGPCPGRLDPARSDPAPAAGDRLALVGGCSGRRREGDGGA